MNNQSNTLTKFIQLNPWSGDHPLLYFKVGNTTLTILANDDNEYYFYDLLKINVEQSIGDEPDDRSYVESFPQQPEYSFIIRNNVNEIKLIENCGEMSLELNTKSNDVSTWLKMDNRQDCQDIYNDIKMALDSSMAKVETYDVIIKPISSWVVYNCRRTVYKLVYKSEMSI